MSQETEKDILNYDDPQNKPKLNTGLNVLTIFTFIGCAFDLYSTVKNFFTGQDALTKMDEAQEKLATAPGWLKKLSGPEVREMMAKAIENKIPLMIIGLVSVGLCIFGAIEMRKLKKQGYTLWLVGELFPYVGSAIFLPAFFNTIFIFFAIFPVLFIILYTIQRKNLKY
jgi:hypothetical protein